ncbi:MAG: hypothetical protein SOI13_01305 [Bifidobacterium mongoliense]|jgi:hypothetical protein|uniref:hypothetical protein n=1 Tax=Bifidobacterium mongoliense TaxID=518643 RepID=UPI002F35450E
MKRSRFLVALAVMVACFCLLVGSDASVTPLRNVILVVVYIASIAGATRYALEARHAK